MGGFHSKKKKCTSKFDDSKEQAVGVENEYGENREIRDDCYKENAFESSNLRESVNGKLVFRKRSWRYEDKTNTCENIYPRSRRKMMVQETYPDFLNPFESEANVSNEAESNENNDESIRNDENNDDYPTELNPFPSTDDEDNIGNNEISQEREGNLEETDNAEIPDSMNPFEIVVENCNAANIHVSVGKEDAEEESVLEEKEEAGEGSFLINPSISGTSNMHVPLEKEEAKEDSFLVEKEEAGEGGFLINPSTSGTSNSHVPQEKEEAKEDSFLVEKEEAGEGGFLINPSTSGTSNSHVLQEKEEAEEDRFLVNPFTISSSNIHVPLEKEEAEKVNGQDNERNFHVDTTPSNSKDTITINISPSLSNKNPNILSAGIKYKNVKRPAPPPPSTELLLTEDKTNSEKNTSTRIKNVTERKIKRKAPSPPRSRIKTCALNECANSTAELTKAYHNLRPAPPPPKKIDYNMDRTQKNKIIPDNDYGRKPRRKRLIDLFKVKKKKKMNN